MSLANGFSCLHVACEDLRGAFLCPGSTSHEIRIKKFNIDINRPQHKQRLIKPMCQPCILICFEILEIIVNRKESPVSKWRAPIQIGPCLSPVDTASMFKSRLSALLSPCILTV